MQMYTEENIFRAIILLLYNNSVIKNKEYRLSRSQKINCLKKDIFPFFSDPQNLAKLTPPWVGFKILEAPSDKMSSGDRIRYRIKLLFFPMYWETIIVEFVDGEYFSDLQLRGPYKLWLHKHTFYEKDGYTVMEDEVLYEMPFSFIGRLVHFFFVKKALQKIFDYRFEAVNNLFNKNA